MRKTSIRRAFALSALAAFSGQGWTQEAVLLGRGGDGNSLYVAILNGTPLTRTVRIRMTYAVPQTIADVREVVASESVEQIDCQNLTHTVTRYELYTSVSAGSVPAWAVDISPSDAKPRAVDTRVESASTLVFRAVCSPTGPLNDSDRSTQVANAQPDPRTPAKVPTDLPPELPSQKQTNPTPPLPPSRDRNPKQDPATPFGDATKQQPTPNPTPQNPYNNGTPIADYRPFPESAFTLGMMGGLAEYVYFDESTLAFREAVLEKVSKGRNWVAQDGKPHPLLDEAYRTQNKRFEDYYGNIRAKEAFLHKAQLKPLPLPKLTQTPIKSFRAELYQYAPTGEAILVFRGSYEALDWVSNLWTGVDLLSIEAPHYRAAHDLVAALRKQKVNPIVVGHSLGGGMAQYVGYKFGLKAVGFNSAPLPERYYNNGAGSDPRYIRLFSAVETVTRPGTIDAETRPDPVSIGLPANAVSIDKLFPSYTPLKARQHLVKPICVKTTLDPFYMADEAQRLVGMVNYVLSKGMVSAIVGGVLPKPGALIADQAVINTIRAQINADLSAPVWRPDNRQDVDNKRVAEEAKNAVAEAAITGYKTAGSATNIAKGSYKFAFGNSWGDMLSGMGTFASMAGKAAAVNYAVTHWLLPHSMARFNRAMHSVASNNVFLADPERAQCETTSTTY